MLRPQANLDEFLSTYWSSRKQVHKRFAEYLKVSGRFDALLADCPLHYTSPNAPSKRDVLGTVLLSVLAGQWRYAHITALRGDGVNPSLLGMAKVRARIPFGAGWSGSGRRMAHPGFKAILTTRYGLC